MGLLVTSNHCNTATALAAWGKGETPCQRIILVLAATLSRPQQAVRGRACLGQRDPMDQEYGVRRPEVKAI